VQFTKTVGPCPPGVERNVRDPGTMMMQMVPILGRTGRSEFLGWAVGRQGYEKGTRLQRAPGIKVSRANSSLPSPYRLVVL